MTAFVVVKVGEMTGGGWQTEAHEVENFCLHVILQFHIQSKQKEVFTTTSVRKSDTKQNLRET